MIVDPGELTFDGQRLTLGGRPVDLVYNRLTDFSLDDERNQALRAAYLADAVVLTPHPRAHALYADKRNLVALTDEAWLQAIGVSEVDCKLLKSGIPLTKEVLPEAVSYTHLDVYKRQGETYTHAMQLNATPLVIAKIMQKQMSGHPRAWIFTSATLAVQKDFAHYRAEMGLAEADSAYWDSPFDYARQALLYAPQNLPDPNSHGFAEVVVKTVFPVLEASGGRAFFLCTSLRAMRRTHELLSEYLERAGLDFPLLLQGEGSKNELLERFRRLGNAILVGSQSFWEGVDVRGQALSLVVIDKLPFAPPDDPVLSARIERCLLYTSRCV